MKKYSVETFMSWENEDLDGQFIRAIALCRPNGDFFAAINCVRDGQMGEKDENGVYERIWWGDNIRCYGNERDIRPATPTEVELYLKYCGYGNENQDYRVVARVYDEHGIHIVFERRGWFARHLYTAVNAVNGKVKWLYFKLTHKVW